MPATGGFLFVQWERFPGGRGGGRGGEGGGRGGEGGGGVSRPKLDKRGDSSFSLYFVFIGQKEILVFLLILYS